MPTIGHEIVQVAHDAPDCLGSAPARAAPSKALMWLERRRIYPVLHRRRHPHTRRVPCHGPTPADLSSRPARLVARILVVEDDAVIRGLVVRGLARSSHEIEETGDGETAAALLDKRHYDVVLTDLQMSGIDGLAVLRKCL